MRDPAVLFLHELKNFGVQITVFPKIMTVLGLSLNIG